MFIHLAHLDGIDDHLFLIFVALYLTSTLPLQQVSEYRRERVGPRPALLSIDVVTTAATATPSQQGDIHPIAYTRTLVSTRNNGMTPNHTLRQVNNLHCMSFEPYETGH